MPKHLTDLEFVVSSVEPINPIKNQMWFDIVENTIKWYDGYDWVIYPYTPMSVFEDFQLETLTNASALETRLTGDLNTHKTSNDHDYKYYTKTDMASTVAGNSGAKKIGVPDIPGVSGNDLETFLENLVTYINNSVQGLSAKSSVQAATTGNITLSGLQTVDGITLIEGDRVLVKNQTSAEENGIYEVHTGVWTRAVDANSVQDLQSAYVWIEQGTANADSGWLMITDNFSLDSTPLSWIQFSGAGQISVGLGLTKQGNTISITPTGVSAGTYKSVTVDTSGRVVSGTNPTTLAGYGVTDAVNVSEVVTTATANKLLKLDANAKLPASITGNADGNAATATKLATAKTISTSGDATGSTTFDGSANANIALTLANSGVAAGTYKSVTVDTKGRVTAGTNPTTLSGYGITDGVNTSEVVTTATANKLLKLDANAKLPASVTGNAGTATKLETARTIVVSGDATGTTTFDGSANVSIDTTLSNTGVVAGTYKSVTVDTKGRVTAASNPTTLAGYGVTDAVSVTDVTTTATANKLLKLDATAKLPASITGNSATATKLETARTISVSGDASGSVSFDGSANADVALTLGNTGVTAGTYKSVTVDTKGRVTAASNPTTLAGYGVTDAVNTSEVVTTATANKLLKLDANAKLPASVTGSSTKLETARTISATGDATGSTTFDGSANANIALTLANSGATAGTYKSVTVDAKGRVTAGTNPTTLAGYGVTDAVNVSDVVTSATANKILKLDANAKLPASITGNADGNAATATKLATARTISATGDATGSTTFDGSANASMALTLANSGVAAGTYPKVTVDTKGRVTAGTTLVASDIPVITASKISDFDTQVQTNALSELAVPTADISMGGNKITNVADPINAQDVVTKSYADALRAGLSIKDPARVATTGTLSTTYASGVLTATSNGAVGIDGITLGLNDRVLVKNQATGSQNGIYTVTQLGDASNPFKLTRAVDFDASAEVVSGMAIWINEGSTNSDSRWVLTTNGNIILDTTSLIFTKDFQSSDITASGGITKTGNNIALTTGVATPGTYKSVTVDTTGRVTAGTNPTTIAGYGITDAVNSSEVVTTATANKLLKLDANAKLPASITGNADGNAATATKLATARNIAVTGDISGNVNFDGSGNVSIPTTLNAGTVTPTELDLGTWGVVARTQGLVIFPEGTVTDDGAGNLTFSSTVAIMNPASGSYVRVASGSYVLPVWGYLYVDIPPTTTRGTSLTPSVGSWVDGDRNYDGVNRVVLAQRVSGGEIYFRGSIKASLFSNSSIADIATKLETARTISATGDATGSTTFDGTANSSMALTLANTGVAAGTYKSVTVDTKGRVTAATNPTTLTGYGITDAQPLDADLTALSGVASNGLLVKTGSGTATSRNIAVSGAGLSITNADGVAGNPTITSNATSVNTMNAVVQRDGSGNFSAGTITAALSGNASTATRLATARTIAVSGDVSGSASFDGSGDISIATTVADNSHNHTSANISDATNANTANMVVKRDASGNFSAGTITAALSGNASTSTTSTNLANGGAGTIPYQTGAGATSMLAAGSTGQVLKSNGTSAPSWQTLDMTFLPGTPLKEACKAATTGDIGASLQTSTTLTGYSATQSLAVTTTASSTTATTTSTAGIKVGSVISGNANIPASTTVVSITNATTFVMSAAATATGSAVTTTFTNTIGALVVDGITLALNDRVLVKNQSTIGGVSVTTYRDNGIYYLSTLGTTSVPWVLTRTADADTASDIAGGITTIDSGSTNGGATFTCYIKGTDTIGSTAMPWYTVADNGKKLSFFASTTSSELASVISDETGSGSLVFGTSPTLSGTPTAPTASADTSTTQIATTAFVTGQASSSSPTANGTATVGTSLKYARADHVHPTDTSRQAALGFTPLNKAGDSMGGNLTFPITNINDETNGIVWSGLTDAHSMFVEEYAGGENTRLVIKNTDNGNSDYTVVRNGTVDALEVHQTSIKTPVQLQSTVAQGTAPFIVASTTVVDNLNVDSVDGKDVDDTKTDATALWTAEKIINSSFTSTTQWSTIANDLNNFTEINSWFHWDTGSGAMANTPKGTLAAGSGQVMFVINYGRNANRMVQECTFLYAGYATLKYIRSKSDSGWGSWEQFWTSYNDGHGSGLVSDSVDGYEPSTTAVAGKIPVYDANAKVPASITGNADGNAATATKLQTARTITISGDVDGSTTFDGSGNVTITTTVDDNSHNHISANISDATNANTANMIVKRDASGNFSAGTITAALSGNASTATTLQTARDINGVAFNGSSDIVVPTIYDSAFKSIINPGGAIFTAGSTESVKTGAIAVTLPVGMTNTMVRMTIKVYEYTTNESFDVHCGGYTYMTGNTWTNAPFAYIVGNPSIDRRFNVRFGYTSGGKAVVYIGETTSSWSYPQVIVTDVQCGYGSYSSSWTTGWTVGFATTLENVTATVSNCQVGYATSTNTANAVVLRDGSGNFSAGTITANLTGTASSASNLTSGSVGAIPFQSAANTTAMLAPGTSGQVLKTNGTAAPSWQTLDMTFLPGTPLKEACKAATTADIGASLRTSTTLTGYSATQSLAVTTTASNTTATITSTAGIKVGSVISGNANIPAGTTVTSITNATTFVMSAAATAAASSVTTTFTNTIAALVVDGITLALNDRVLVKNQSTVGGVSTTANVDNGIYYVSQLGTTSVPWVLTRTSDADSASDIAGGVTTIDSGTNNGGAMFTCYMKGTDTIGTTAMPWYAVSDNGKKLNFFASTSSSELASVISDDTGSGALVFSISPSLSTPKISTSINDSNGNEAISLTATSSAVNNISVANAATGAHPSITSIGSDANINLNLTAKGTGIVHSTSTLGISKSGDDATLLQFNTERSWYVKQKSTGGTTALAFESGTSDKQFFIQRPGITPALEVFVSDTAGSQYAKVDGNLVWHAGNDGHGSGLVSDSVDGYEPSTTAIAGKIAVYDGSAKIPGSITGNADGNAATATKLQTARTLSLTGDVTGSATFDGSANASITATVADNSHSHISSNISDATNANTGNMIVKRDASGNFSAGTVYASLSGNASTATKWAAPITMTLGTDLTGSVAFDGSGNVTLNASVVDDSHNHVIANVDNLQTTLDAISRTLTATLPATAGWYRIAQSDVGIGRCSGRFEVDWALSGDHGQVIFSAATMYGAGISLNETLYSSYAANGLTKARIVYHTTFTGNYAYVEVYNSTAAAIAVTCTGLGLMGWSLVTPSTAGSIPSGYSSREVTFIDGISTEGQINSSVATGTAPLVVASTTKVTNLNADKVDDIEAASFLRSDINDDFIGTLNYTPDSGTVLAFDGLPVLRRFAGANSKSLGVGGDDTLFLGAGESTSTMSANITDGRETVEISGESGVNIHVPLNNWDTWSNKVTTSFASDGIYWNGNQVWHAGNDGHGSGLVSDSVDGIEGTSIARNDTTNTFSLGQTFSSYSNFAAAMPITGFYTQSTGTSNGGYWARLCYAEATGQYQEKETKLNIIGGQNGGTTFYSATVHFRVKQQNALASAPIVTLYISDNVNLTIDNIKAVTTVNDATHTIVGLYVQIPITYEQFRYHPVISNSMNYVNGETLLSALPAGTQTSCVVLPIDAGTVDGFNTSTTAVANKIVVYDANAKVPASITGNADGNAATATKLQTARTITLSGDVDGSTTFDGSGNVTITTTVDDNSHNHTSSNISDATNANTANMIVKRDASGNFSAGTITATLSGNAATATKLANARTISATGDATGSTSFDGNTNVSMALTLANSGATAGTYKSVTVDAKGRVTAGTNPTTISGYGITDAYTKSEINTFRNETFDNFTFTGGAVTATANALEVSVSAGTFYIGGQRFTTSVTTKTLTASTTQYIYINSSGAVTNSTSAPTGDFAALATVAVPASGVIPGGNITDTRNIITNAYGAYAYSIYGSGYAQTITQRGTGGAFLVKDGGTNKFIIDASGNTKLYNGADLFVYSDEGTTSKFSVDGATGNMVTAGTIVATGTITGTLSGNAATATKLANARTISATGDATGSTSFDGNTNVSMALTLANSGATAGTYKSVTVDAKGRVTAGTNPTTISGYGITDAYTKSEINTFRNETFDNFTFSGGAVTATANALEVSVSAGTFYVGGQRFTTSTTTKTITASTATWVYINSSGAVSTATSAPTGDYAALAYIAATASGVIPAGNITDTRNIITSAYGAYVYSVYSTGYAQTITQRGTGGAFLVKDGSTDKFIIDASGNTKLYNGADLLIYSDAGTTNKFSVDGATGNISTSGSFYTSNTTDVSLTSTGNAIQIGASSGINMVIDGNEIMSRNNNATNTLALNGDGGNVTINGQDALHKGNTEFNTWDTWFRRTGDSDHVRMYGNSRSMVFRTDGSTAYGDNGAYPFIWLYGGDSAATNRKMLLNSSGQLWTSDYGYLHDKFVNSAGDTLTGDLDFNVSGGEKHVRSGTTGSNWGMYFNTNGMGCYDWTSGRNIWSYAETGNSMTISPTLNVGPLNVASILCIKPAGNAAIEIGRVDGVASTPVIDFHSGATVSDYDVRLYVSGGNGSNGGGHLDIQCTTLRAAGNLVMTTTDFSNNTSTNGYQRLPNGIIIQWGYNAGTTGTYHSYNYPIAFPNGVRSVVATHQGWGGTQSISGVTLTKFDFYSQGSGTETIGFNWIAIGY